MLHQIIVSLRRRLRHRVTRVVSPRVARSRYWLPVLLAGLYVASTIAKEVDTAQTGTARQGGSLLMIERDGHTVYLFGTIHVGSADFFPLAQPVMRALAASSQIAIEIDTSDTDAVSKLVQQYALYQDDSASARDIPIRLARQVLALLDQYRMSAGEVIRMKPWLLATVLTTEAYASNGFPKEHGVDDYLSAYARTHHKPVIGLESVEYQLSLLGNLSIADQNRFLQDTVTDLNDPVRAKMALDLVALWRNGDLIGLNTLLKEMTSDDTFTGQFIQRALLDGRNPALADAIEKLLASGKTSFAGIGMLHLVGNASVQQLLRQRGYSVRRTY